MICPTICELFFAGRAIQPLQLKSYQISLGSDVYFTSLSVGYLTKPMGYSCTIGLILQVFLSGSVAA